MSKSYGEIFSDMVDEAAQYEERGQIFRIFEVRRNQFYNVTNPNRQTSGGNPYPFPMEWMVRATREFKNYALVRTVVKDCGGLFLSPDDLKELQDVDAEAALALFKKIVGAAKGKNK